MDISYLVSILSLWLLNNIWKLWFKWGFPQTVTLILNPNSDNNTVTLDKVTHYLTPAMFFFFQFRHTPGSETGDDDLALNISIVTNWPGSSCKFHPWPDFNKLLPSVVVGAVAELGTKANLCQVKCGTICQTTFLTPPALFNFIMIHNSRERKGIMGHHVLLK